MFHMVRNKAKNGTIVARVVAGLRDRLPPGWGVVGPRRGASSLRLRGPDGRVAKLSIVVRRSMAPRDVVALLGGTDGPLLVVAPFLGGRARQLIAEAGSSFADATGNLRIVTSRPAVFLEAAGAQRDPERTPRPLQSLRGAAAARVLRGLLELDLPLGVRGLAEAAESPLGTTSRVVSFLESEALLERDAQKRVVTVDRPALVTRWAEDYELIRSNELQTFLEPLGLDALWKKLARLDRYAATGSIAGLGIAPPRIAPIYVDDPETAARELGLVPAEAGANVWLLRPYDDVVFARTGRRAVKSGAAETAVTVVAPGQAAVDLLTSPGRGPAEGEELLARWRQGTEVRSDDE